jgi:metal-responsive CopG/Arc/MetJ family transcriptional regulator
VSCADRFEGRSISLPGSLWETLEQVKQDRRDPSLSATVRELLLDHLAETNYLQDREKRARLPLRQLLQTYDRKDG